MSGRDAILAAFDELFDAAAARLNVAVTPQDRDEARARFREHFEKALEAAGTVEMTELPRPVLDEMKEAVARLSMAELAGVVASIPLAQRTQEMMRAVAMRQAEQRLLEHYALQADDRYGGH
jgi:ABC-type branched-subunit amino acid transport system substrate-binding protein